MQGEINTSRSQHSQWKQEVFVVPFAIYHSEPSTQTHTERVEKISGSQKLPSKTWKSWHYHWNATWALALEKQWPIKIIDCHLAAPKKKKKNLPQEGVKEHSCFGKPHFYNMQGQWEWLELQVQVSWGGSTTSRKMEASLEQHSMPL